MKKIILLSWFFMTFHGFTPGGRAIKHEFKTSEACNKARTTAVVAMRAQTFFKAEELVSICIKDSLL